MDSYPDITGKHSDPVKVAIGRKLAEVVIFHEGLWRKVAELARDPDFCLIEDYSERILAEGEMLERDIGRDPGLSEIKSLVSSLSQRATQ